MATADMVLPRAAQQVMTEEPVLEGEMVEKDEAADTEAAAPSPSPFAFAHCFSYTGSYAKTRSQSNSYQRKPGRGRYPMGEYEYSQRYQ